jgi:hypothetical protein
MSIQPNPTKRPEPADPARRPDIDPPDQPSRDPVIEPSHDPQERPMQDPMQPVDDRPSMRETHFRPRGFGFRVLPS